MGKEQQGISDARGHENEQKRRKNRLRQKNKRGETNPKRAHSNNRQQSAERATANAFQRSFRATEASRGLVTQHY